MELLLFLFFVVGISRWAAKHDRTLLTKDEYDDLWRKSPYASTYREILVNPPKKRRWLFLR